MQEQDDIEFKLIKAISEDKRFGEDADAKLEHFASKFPKIVQLHPLSLIYASTMTDNVNDCNNLVSRLSKFYNHPRTTPSSQQILSMVDLVSQSKKSHLHTIFDAEKSNLPIILGMPIIFFKACNERDRFNREHLLMMLDYKNKIDNSEMSQHDASVGVGAVLVDKYVKPKIN